MYIGQDNRKDEHILGVQFTNKAIKCLGVYVGGQFEECQNLNWLPKLTAMEDTIEKWKRRDLTILGKITVIKTLIISKITYIATNCVIPDY